MQACKDILTEAGGGAGQSTRCLAKHLNEQSAGSEEYTFFVKLCFTTQQCATDSDIYQACEPSKSTRSKHKMKYGLKGS